MKVSCLPVSFFSEILNGKMRIIDWARLAKQVDLDAIDISTTFVKNHTPTYLDSLKREIESEGVKITMVATYPDFTHPDSIAKFEAWNNTTDGYVAIQLLSDTDTLYSWIRIDVTEYSTVLIKDYAVRK